MMIAIQRKQKFIFAFTVAVLMMFFSALSLTGQSFLGQASKNSSKTPLDLKEYSSSTPAMINAESESKEPSGQIIQSDQTGVEGPRSADFEKDDYDKKLMSTLDEEVSKTIARWIIPESIPLRMRISKDINLLKNESIEQSVKMLSQVGMFYWPGAGNEGAGGIILPLRKTIGQFDIDGILSNRRFLKVYDELSGISGSKASSLIIEQISETIPLYRRMFSESWDKVTRIHQNEPPEARQTIGPSFQISDDPNGTPTLAGIRLQLLSLVIVAGNLQLEQTRPAVVSVVSEALAQKRQFYKSSSGHEGDRFIMLKTISLYNRQALATGILLTSNTQTITGLRTLIDEENRWQTRKLTRYDAAATPYDLLTRHGGPIKVDYSKGVLTVRFHRPLDDDEFVQICRSVGIE